MRQDEDKKNRQGIIRFPDGLHILYVHKNLQHLDASGHVWLTSFASHPIPLCLRIKLWKPLVDHQPLFSDFHLYNNGNNCRKIYPLRSLWGNRGIFCRYREAKAWIGRVRL